MSSWKYCWLHNQHCRLKFCVPYGKKWAKAYKLLLFTSDFLARYGIMLLFNMMVKKVHSSLSLFQTIFLLLYCPVGSHGLAGKINCGKRAFTNVVFYCQISQVWPQEDTAMGTSALGVLYLLYLLQVCGVLYNMSRRGLTALLILGRGNARAWQWDKRRVENPTSFLYKTESLNLWGFYRLGLN